MAFELSVVVPEPIAAPHLWTTQDHSRKETPVSRKPQMLLTLAALLLGLTGPAHAECLDETYDVEVLEAGTQTKLPDGQQVTSSAKTSAGVLEARALVKKGVIVSSGLSLDGKAGKETPLGKLPAEAQKCAKQIKPVSLAPKPVQALAALVDFVLPTAEARSCRAKLIFRAEHCVYDEGRRSCGYASVYYSTCNGQYYVM